MSWVPIRCRDNSFFFYINISCCFLYKRVKIHYYYCWDLFCPWTVQYPTLNKEVSTFYVISQRANISLAYSYLYLCSYFSNAWVMSVYLIENSSLTVLTLEYTENMVLALKFICLMGNLTCKEIGEGWWVSGNMLSS